MRRSLLFAGLLITFAANGYAQTPSNRSALTGVVQDQTGAAIVGARVELSGGGVLPQSATTDQSGGFRFMRVPPEQRRIYVFDGNSQALDHILATDSLFDSLVRFDVVHINSEFVDQASDHDPTPAIFRLPAR